MRCYQLKHRDKLLENLIVSAPKFECWNSDLKTSNFTIKRNFIHV